MYRRQSGVDLELIRVAALSPLWHPVLVCPPRRPRAALWNASRERASRNQNDCEPIIFVGRTTPSHTC